MGRKLAICMAVKKAGDLVELPGAIAGANEFEKWAAENDYGTHLLTDASGQALSASAIKDVVFGEVKQGAIDRLILYFAGHGACPYYNTEFLLLSNWHDDPNEAINVEASLMQARRAGIKQIALIADACRSTFADAIMVSGTCIFPSGRKLENTQCDEFRATNLGKTAQEVRAPDGGYGIFSRCLMKALGGTGPHASERVGETRPAEFAVTSQSLARFLLEDVPRTSGQTPGAVTQYPAVLAGWMPPDNRYTQPRRVHPDDLHRAPADDWGAAFATAMTAALNLKDDRELDPFLETPAFRQIDDVPVGAGVSVIGASVSRVASTAGFETFVGKDGSWHARGRIEQPCSVAVQLANKRWIAGTVVPNFATVYVVGRDGGVDLFHLPSARGDSAPASDLRKLLLLVSRWTALMKIGRLHSDVELRRLAEHLRGTRQQHPSLGVLAAYAFERAGALSDVKSVADCFGNFGFPVPFDVAFLAGLRPHKGLLVNGAAIGPAGNELRVAGSFPSLTQGWMQLDSANDRRLHPALQDIRRGLQPSLWTMLNDEMGAKLAGLIRENAL